MIKDMLLINDNKNLKKINLYWLISLLFIVLIRVMLTNIKLVEYTTLFDIEHYFNIANDGYTKTYEYAFFPIIPIIMKAFGYLNISIIGMIVINNIACLISTYLLFNISLKIYNQSEKTSMLIALLWIFSPIRIFTYIPYTESLFMLFSLLTFYLYKKKESPLLLGLVMGLSVATRSMGAIMFFVIFACLFIDILREKDKETKIGKFKYLLITYIPATIISCLYPLYLQIKTGSWRYFIDVQYEHWGRIKGNIFDVINFDMERLIETPYLEVKLQILFFFISLFILIMLIVLSLLKSKTERLDLILISIFSVYVMCSTYRYTDKSAGCTSFFRYIYALISMYLLVDDKFGKFIKALLLLINTILFVITTSLLLMGYFIA